MYTYEPNTIVGDAVCLGYIDCAKQQQLFEVVCVHYTTLSLVCHHHGPLFLSPPPLSLSTIAFLQIKEKDIATKLKWNLNAVTAADFIEELSRRLSNLLLKTTLDKLVDHCHTLANICLLSTYT